LKPNLAPKQSQLKVFNILASPSLYMNMKSRHGN